MDTSIDAYIGMGANLGDRIQAIIDARDLLSSLSYCSKLISSSLYWSSPVGYADQPGFINCAVKMTINSSTEIAGKLFEDMQAIELSLGRQRCKDNQNAPRTIDLDMLLFGNEKISSEKLTVPHPRMLDRRFVIEPLLELAPSLSIDSVGLEVLYSQHQREGRYKGQEVHRLGK